MMMFITKTAQETAKFLSRYFFLTALIIFSLSFHFDFLFQSPERLRYPSQMGDYYVLGRFTRSMQAGMWSHFGLPGRCKGPFLLSYNCRAFVQNKPCDYLVYKSETGGQSALYYLIYKLYPFKDRMAFVSLLRFLVGAAFAFVIALFLNFIKRQYGLFTACASVILILNLGWLVLFGDNLLLSFWAMALIPLLIWHAITRKKNIVLYSFIALALKCFTSGGNFVFSCLAMALLPLVYLAFSERWNAKRISQTLLKISFGAALGCLFVFLVLVLQLSLEFGLPVAKDHLLTRIQVRTYAAITPNLLSTPALYSMKASLEAPLMRVIKDYLNVTMIWLPKINPAAVGKRFTFLDLTILLFLSSVVSRLIKQRITPLIATAWASFLVPIASIIIAKSHAAAHRHYDPVIITIPFGMLVMVVFSKSLEDAFLAGYSFMRQAGEKLIKNRPFSNRGVLFPGFKCLCRKAKKDKL